MKADKILTELAHFEDPKSYVRRDGSEVLYRKDWKKRVDELRERCGGQCEQEVQATGAFNLHGPAYVRCTSEAADPDHIIKRSKHRDDRLSNLQGLCRYHHDLKHPEKQPMWTHRSGR